MPVTNYIWDVVSDNVLMEKDDEGNTTARYVQQPSLYGAAISQERGGETRYYNYDGLGNTAELTDENENVTDTNEYSAFGEEVARTGTTENPFAYKGALGYYTNGGTDEIYVRVRTYDPKIGRWLDRKPQVLRGQSSNYLLDRNSPVIRRDPPARASRSVAVPQRSCIGAIYCVGAAPAKHCGISVKFGPETWFQDGMPKSLPSGCLEIYRDEDNINAEWGIDPRDSASYQMICVSKLAHADCMCIRRYMNRFNAAPCIEYNLTTCNSNFALRCIIEHCSLPITWKRKPKGYDCRICKERTPTSPMSGATCCTKWGTQDCP